MHKSFYIARTSWLVNVELGKSINSNNILNDVLDKIKPLRNLYTNGGIIFTLF